MMARRPRDNLVHARFGGPRKTRWTDERSYVRRTPKRQRSSGWAMFIPLWGGAALFGAAYGAGWLDGTGDANPVALISDAGEARTNFSLCHTGGGYNCVVDGDTIWLKGQKIRVADIDAPETHEPSCPSEKELGDRATLRLRELLQGGAITLQQIDRDEDRYGRKLRIILVNGESAGETLVSEGLARRYAGGRRPWC